jgi:hypothetical protein
VTALSTSGASDFLNADGRVLEWGHGAAPSEQASDAVAGNGPGDTPRPVPVRGGLRPAVPGRLTTTDDEIRRGHS